MIVIGTLSLFGTTFVLIFSIGFFCRRGRVGLCPVVQDETSRITQRLPLGGTRTDREAKKCNITFRMRR